MEPITHIGGTMNNNKVQAQYILLAEKVVDITKKIAFLENEKKHAYEQLQALCDNQEYSYNGYNFNKVVRQGPVQYKSIPELQSVNLDQYRGDPVEYWKVTHHEQFSNLIKEIYG